MKLKRYLNKHFVEAKSLLRLGALEDTVPVSRNHGFILHKMEWVLVTEESTRCNYLVGCFTFPPRLATHVPSLNMPQIPIAQQ